MDKVLCPYCGREMKLIDQFPSLGFWFYCDCGAMAPIGKTIEEAYAAAIRRPLQKPLTLFETKNTKTGVCRFLELRPIESRPCIYAACVVFDVPTKKNDVIVCMLHGKTMRINSGSYGKTWRCWATKPTQEEREAAKWE